MIARQYRNPLVIFQTPDDAGSIAEPAIAASHDDMGLIILNQEGREILVNRSTVPDLVRALRELSKQ